MASIEELSELLMNESEALIEASGESGERIADIHVRLALLAQDVLSDVEQTAHYCELAQEHPLTLALLRSQALGATTEADLDVAQEHLERSFTNHTAAEVTMLRQELAEAWLYRFDGAERAAQIATTALEGADGEIVESLQHTLYIALAKSGQWVELESLLAESESPRDAAEAARIAFDCVNDEARAIELLSRCADTAGELALYSTLLESELSWVGADIDRLSTLRRRLELVSGDASNKPEALAIRYLLAQELDAAGDREGALTELAGLTDAADEPRPTPWGAQLARQARVSVAIRAGQWPVAAEILAKLAASASGAALRISYQRRLAELLEHRLESHGESLRTWLDLFREIPEDRGVERNLERQLLGDAKGLVAHLRKAADADPPTAGASLRRAAGVAESRLQDLDLAVELAKLRESKGQTTRDLFDLARLHRKRGEHVALASTYRRIASLEEDAKLAAPLLLVAGVLLLSEDKEKEALESFQQAAKLDPQDVGAQAALAMIYRNRGMRRELRQALSSLADSVSHEVTRFDTLRELGEVCMVTNDRTAARKILGEALEIRSDSGLLLALASLCDAGKEWQQAAELRRRAIDSLSDGPQTAVVWLEIGRIEQEELKNAARAREAFEEALRCDSANLETLRRLQAICAAAGDLDKQLEALRAEIDLTDQSDRRLSLLLESAEVAQRVTEPIDDVLEIYSLALMIDSNNQRALQGLADVAAKHGKWQAIIEAFSQARETAANVSTLCDAYRAVKDWGHFVELSNRRIALLTSKSEKANLSIELAKICETELGDDAQAAAAYKKALSFEPTNATAQTELRRLLEGGGHWRELARALEDELKAIPSEEVDRQVEIMYRLGQVRRDQLNRSSEAALAYEAIIERRPKETKALDALEALYQSLGRDRDLLRVLEMRAASTPSAKELGIRVAELRVQVGDVDGAIRAFAEAFAADPSNRDTFTALEKLCYSQERWRDAMQLYDSAIASVESGATRSYRLGDLYSRRGQVLMQYMGDLENATGSYLRVLEVEPDDEIAMQALDALMAQRQDWAGLLDAYERRAARVGALATKVESLRSAARIARDRLMDDDRAAGLFLRVLELDATDIKAIDFLEQHYSKTQQWQQLVVVLEKQLAGLLGEDERKLVPLLQRLAKISEEGLRDEDRAIRYYQRLVDVAPQNRRALDALSRIYESTERWTEFVEVTRRQTKITKDRNVKALLFFKCGSVMEAKFNREDEAIRYYDAAIKTSPACLPAVHGLRDLYLRRQDWPRVIQTLELEVKLWQDDKERAGVFAQIGRIYGEELVQSDRAMHYYESALAVDPDCVPANRALFEHYFETQQWDRAEPLAHALAQKAMRDGDPTRRSDFYRKRGIVARHIGEPVAAAESIVIALEIKPANIEALESLIQISETSPQAYDFPATFRELEKIYRRRDDSQLHLARVMAAQAIIRTRAGDLAAAEVLLKEAIERCPSDFGVVSALVELHVSVRSWTRAAEVIDSFVASVATDKASVTEALLKQAEIFADGEMNPEKAVRVLKRVLAQDPQNPEVYYRLAQELYGLGRYADARAAIERVIELSAAPGVQLSPERLARYYYYLGRIIDASGESRAASSQYRRAAEYDPKYAPPALALAMISVASGDRPGAERKLIEAAHAAMEQGGAPAAVPMQRGLARILYSGGDRDAAIEAYRGILAVEPNNAADRLALAEIYAVSDLRKALQEVGRVIQSDLRHGPAYRTLATYYLQAGEAVRAARVVTAMELLGYADAEDRALAAKARATVHRMPLRHSMTLELHNTLLINDAMRSPVGQLFGVAYAALSALFPQHSLGENLVPLNAVEDAGFQNAAVETARLFGIEPEIYVGENVPGAVAVIASPRRIAVFDRKVLAEPDAVRRFALGWAFEGIGTGCAMLLQLGQKQRTELGSLMRSMFLRPEERPPQTNEFIKGLPPAAHEVLRRHEGEFQDLDIDDWVDGVHAVARRAGLLACDDLVAATHMLAMIAGEYVGDQAVALGTVFCGSDLFRFYVSDDYHRLRESLSRPGPTMGS